MKWWFATIALIVTGAVFTIAGVLHLTKPAILERHRGVADRIDVLGELTIPVVLMAIVTYLVSLVSG